MAIWKVIIFGWKEKKMIAAKKTCQKKDSGCLLYIQKGPTAPFLRHTNDNNYVQQRALVDDDTTAIAEYDMTLGSSSSVIYDFESNEERRMQTNTSSVSEFCMLQASNPSNGKLVCVAQDIKFSEVTGFNILDGQNLEACNCTTTNSIDPPCISPYDIDCGDYAVGTVYGACQGGEGLDTITLEMNVK